MPQKAIPREKIPSAIEILLKKFKVVAPTPKGKSFVFSRINDPAQAVLDYPTTIVPLKKFFMPPNDLILSYNMHTQEAKAPETAAEPTVFFGIHNYELQGVLRLDHAFRNGVPDPAYLRKRENAFFIGVSYEPDEYHFADSVGIPVGLREGFDAFLTRVGGFYRFEAFTDAGRSFEADLSKLFTDCGETEAPVVHFKNKLKQSVAGIREVFHGAYTHPVWQKTARECYSCGTCNISCPTCYCFDVDDQTTLGAADGVRLRKWDSCQFQSFTTVAGGEVFREKRNDRVRHRMSRKFAYIMDDKGRPFCVGCGRCVRQCTAKINIVDVMNALL
jgi:NAD-dependent dihydropyrimidine dehydrogenase PreA subunit